MQSDLSMDIKTLPSGRQLNGLPMSALCQKRTLGNSLDHLSGNGQHTGRNGEAKRPRGFQVDHELKLRRLDDRQVCWQGERRFRRDLPDAEIHLLDTGHFALDEKNDEIAGLILEFLAKHRD